MRPPHEGSNFANNFEARFDARISKLFDILASNCIAFLYLHHNFYEQKQAITNLYKNFCKKIKNENGERKPFSKNCYKNILFSTTKVGQILRIEEKSYLHGMMLRELWGYQIV